MSDPGGLLATVRDSGWEFGMVVGHDAADDLVVDVQIAALGPAAAALVEVVQAWHEAWMAAGE